MLHISLEMSLKLIAGAMADAIIEGNQGEDVEVEELATEEAESIEEVAADAE